MQDKLFIITGASGKLGLAFIQELGKRGEKIVALTRKDVEANNLGVHKTDLLNESEVALTLDKIGPSNYKEIYLIHAVGKFKFEKSSADIVDADKDGIDDDIYSTNVLTLKNVLKGLLAHSSVAIKVCAFASVSDKYDIPFWNSYTKAKNIIRSYLRELCELAHIQALIVNVSTVNTENENDLRPNADRTYWLQPYEIVEKTLPELFSLSTYKEIDIIKEKPAFDPSYYLDHEAILKKWEDEMKNN